MTYRTRITNLKTGRTRTFYAVGDYPDVERIIDRVEDETPTGDLSKNRTQYQIIVSTV